MKNDRNWKKFLRNTTKSKSLDFEEQRSKTRSSDFSKNLNLKRNYTRKTLRRNNKRKFKRPRNYDEICCIRLKKQRLCCYRKMRLS